MNDALLASLGLALTWTPTLSHFLIRSHRGHGRAHEGHTESTAAGGFLGGVLRVYKTILRGALDHPWLMALSCLALVAGSFVCYRALGTDLLPAMDEGGFILDYWMPPGTSLADTNRVLTSIEEMLRDTPEVESTSRRTGLELGLIAVTEANTGDFTVKLKRNRSRGVEEITAELRRKIRERFPMLDVEFVQLLQDMIGDLTSAPEPVEIKLFSEDQTVLRQWAPRVAEAIGGIPGVVDVLDGIQNTISGPALVFRVDPVVASRAGFTPEEVEIDASAIMQGEEAATPVIIGDRSYAIRVRFPEPTRASLDSIRSTILGSSAGRTSTLGALAHVEELPGQMEILSVRRTCGS